MKAGLLPLLLCLGGCWALSSGPPIGQAFVPICEQLRPQELGPIDGQQTGDGGFQVLTNLTRDNAGGFIYSSGETYSVVIVSTNDSFRGFLVQARSSPIGNLIGEFTVSDPNLQQTLNCDPMGVATEATVSHLNLSSNYNFQSVNLLWTAPNLTNASSDNLTSTSVPEMGVVNITFTIVVTMETYYIARNAADQPYVGTPGLNSPEDYQLSYRTPSGCVPPDCVTFVGVNTSNVPGYLQFYLEGQGTAWVAMGFSLTRNMFDADVMACNVNSITGQVELLDTWNPSQPNRANIVDSSQDGVLLNASSENGLINCTFVRSISGTELAQEDLNLNQTLFGMWGVGQQPSAGRLLAHEVMPRSAIPETSFQPLNPALDTDADRVSQPSNDSAAYNLTYRTPRGCLPPNCSTFVGVAVNARNPSYLDFFLQGQATAWVAMGFSLTRNMFDADVLACNVNPDTGVVEVLDVWTPSSPTRAATTDSQQDATLISSSVQDGIITCTFVRTITGTAVGAEDLNLNQTLFGMWGVGQTQAAGRILQHAVTPVTSVQPLNPVLDTDLNRIRETPRDPEDYRLILRQPENCSAPNCSVFVGISTNNVSDQFLDIYMQAESSSWVAVGFTQSRNMFSADVLGCNVDPGTGLVQVLDTWNPAQPTRNNVLDDMQDATLFNSSIANGRISCSISRYIPGSADEIGNGDTEDVNLNGDYFILYGVGPAPPATPAANSLIVHDTGPGNPRATAVMVNPVTDNQTALNIIGGLPAGVTQPDRNPGDYRLILRSPSGCDPAQCDIFVGIDTNAGNDQYLDFTLQGNSQGWVAVGFSASQNMFAADVMGCSVDPDTGLIAVLDAWNLDLDLGRGNVGDDVQDTFLFQGSVVDQRISCTFSRLTTGSDTTGPNVQDVDLNNPFFAMYGVGPTSSATNLPAHNLGAGNNPILTGGQVSAATDTGDVQGDTSRGMLIRAHGILMIVAWPVMAVTAIFFAAWMRPALPNGQWFQIHRVLLSMSILVGGVGFILIFIAFRNNSPPGLITLGPSNAVGTTHYVFGFIVMFLHILNPIISACRCKPDGKYRWIFNLVHGSFVGMIAELLALTNVGIGLSIFGRGLSSTGLAVFWLYIAYVGFFLAMIFFLFLLYTILAYSSTGEDKRVLVPSLVKPLVSSGSYTPANTVDQGVELAVPGVTNSTTNEKEMSKPKPPSKDAPIRWFSLLVYALVMIPVMIILIILVAI